MRFVLSSLAVLAAIVLIVVSSACNYLFMYSIGKTEVEGLVLGSASVAVDVFKALLPVLMWWAWGERRVGFLLPAAIVFVVFSAWSLASAIGFSASNRGYVAETREGLNAEYVAVQKDMERIEEKRAALIPHRPAGVIENEIGGLRQNRRWQSTKECSDGGATAAASRKFCARYFTLKSELSASVEDRRLTQSLSTLRAEAKRLKGRGAGGDSDPQVSFFAKLFGHDKGSIRTILTIFISSLLELGSGLGLWLATGHSEIFRRKKKPSEASQTAPESDKLEPQSFVPKQVIITQTLPPLPSNTNHSVNAPVLDRRYAIEARKMGDIDDFCFDRLHPADDDAALSLQDIYAGYVIWCEDKCFQPMDNADFLREFKSMAQDVGLPSSGGKYLGVELSIKRGVAA